jgi:hypothetical protein
MLYIAGGRVGLWDFVSVRGMARRLCFLPVSFLIFPIVFWYKGGYTGGLLGGMDIRNVMLGKGE